MTMLTALALVATTLNPAQARTCIMNTPGAYVTTNADGSRIKLGMPWFMRIEHLATFTVADSGAITGTGHSVWLRRVRKRCHL